MFPLLHRSLDRPTMSNSYLVVNTKRLYIIPPNKSALFEEHMRRFQKEFEPGTKKGSDHRREDQTLHATPQLKPNGFQDKTPKESSHHRTLKSNDTVRRKTFETDDKSTTSSPPYRRGPSYREPPDVSRWNTQDDRKAEEMLDKRGFIDSEGTFVELPRTLSHRSVASAEGRQPGIEDPGAKDSTYAKAMAWGGREHYVKK